MSKALYHYRLQVELLDMRRFLGKSSKQKLTFASFEFTGESAQLDLYVCPVCGSHKSVDYLRVQLELDWIQMVKCGCGSLFYPGRKAPDYTVVEAVDSFYMRIDQAEGIDSIIMPMFLNENLRKLPVADIGCGMGFGADFLRFYGREVVAFDPSFAAKMSSKVLGIEIVNEVATPGSIVLPEPALMFASEVIEHVDDPLVFMETIRSFAGTTGYAILTTPNAEFVSESAPKEQVMAMLAPSQHLFLFSPTALEALAIKAGFAWAKTYVHEDRLFLLCGPTYLPLQIDFKREEYLTYLENRLEDSSIDKLVRFRCFGYRLLKELIHLGNYDRANQVFDLLRNAYLDLGLDLYDPASIVKKMSAESKSGSMRLRTDLFPFNLGNIFSLMVTYQVAVKHDVLAAAPYAKAVLEIGGLYETIFGRENIFSAYDLEVKLLVPRMQEQIKLHGIPKK